MFTFETFSVYQKSKLLYRDIYLYLKQNKVDRYLSDQLRRAALSIILNIAEGSGKYGAKDKKHFYLVARASVHECAAAIDILILLEPELQLLPAQKAELLTIHKMLSGMIRALLERDNRD